MAKLLKGKHGFTLVEVVMVLVIIGLLASIVIPKFSNQREQAGIAATKASLESLRTVVALYYAQEGEWPASAALADLWDGSSPSTTVYIKAIPYSSAYDPSGAAPAGPLNKVVITLDGTGGWIWNSTTYEVSPNLTGMDANGLSFAQY